MCDVYEDFFEDSYFFDFSEIYRQDSAFDPVNKKVISKMKNEFRGKIIRGHSKVRSLRRVEGGVGGGVN